MFLSKYLAPTLAAALLSLGFAIESSPAFADPSPSRAGLCKKAKKKKAKKARTAKKTKSKAKAKKLAAAPTPAPVAKPRMNHETVIGMHRRGATQSEIVSTAEKFGYTADASDQEAMAQARLPKTLIAKLAAEDAAPPPKAEGIKLETITSYEDIDFDAVPPPPGTPDWVKQQNARKAAAKPAMASAPVRAQPAVHKASTVRKVEVEEDEDEPTPAPAPSSGRRAIVAAQ